MNILITGGAGYVGTELIGKLERDERVTGITVFDNLSKGHHNFFMGSRHSNHGKIRFVKGEILDSRLLRREAEKSDVIVHLAAVVTTPFANTDPHFYEQVNHWGTAEVVYAAEACRLSKLIYVSSTSVYGASKDMVEESTQPSPTTFYGVSKLRGEEHVRRLMDARNAIILRSGNAYGYNRCARFDAVINRFMFDAHFSRRIQVFGTGRQVRAFVSISNLAAHIHSAVVNDVPNGVYNLVDSNLAIEEVVDALKEIYPDLEFLFTNQHMGMRELRVNPESSIFQFLPRRERRDLKSDLLEFREEFAF